MPPLPDPPAPGDAPPASGQGPLRNLRRLGGREPLVNLLSSSRLWLGEDSLVQLKTTGYSQRIQRFAYRDIQALEICGSSRWWVYNLVLGVPLLGFGLLGLGVSNGPRLVLWILAVVFLGLLLINLLRGPTCRCVLQTVLGPQVLASLSRQRTARRAVALITERVEAAQGEEGRR